VAQKSANRTWGCIGILIVAVIISLALFNNQTRPTVNVTLTLYAQGTQIALANATGTRRAVDSINKTATATLWTPTNTPTPSDTPTASNTPTITPTPSITNTPRPTATITDTNVPAITNYVRSNANARACEHTDCDVVARLTTGTSVSVIGSVEGANVSGNTTWMQVRYQGDTVYIHSSLLSENPIPTPAPVIIQQAPVQQDVISTVPPAPMSQAPAFTCSCSKTCEQVVSCEEAYYQLNQCGCSRRDSDDDGVPCENICPGG